MLIKVEVEQACDGLGRDLRGVAGKNNDVIVGGECRLSDHQSVAGAALLGLQNEIDAGAGNGAADSVGFVADDGEDIIRRDDPGGRCDDMSEKRLAANFMQNLGKL